MWNDSDENDNWIASLDKRVVKSIIQNSHKISHNIYPIFPTQPAPPIQTIQYDAPMPAKPMKQALFPKKLHSYYNRQHVPDEQQQKSGFFNSSDENGQNSGTNMSSTGYLQSVQTSFDAVYKVQFKTCYRFYSSSFEVFKKGDFVIVSSEYGGEHLGMVILILPSWESFQQSGPSDPDMTPDDRLSGFVGNILRVAERWECELLPQKAKDERFIHTQCMKLIQTIQTTKSLRLLKMHDVECQFDRSVVYLQYSATEARVDFRDFMKQIGQLCGVPVQMVRFNEAYNFAPKKFAEIGLTTGAVYL